MTDLILKIEGVGNALSVEFYIEREKTVRFLKEDLIRVYRNEGVEYYAFIDSNILGRGHVMASVEFVDHEAEFDRRVTVSGYTGYSIPCMGSGNTISCGEYEVSFKKVNDVPKNDAMIYYGVTTDSFERLDLRALTAIKNPTEAVLTFNPGERVVVLIPYDWDEVATKDGGMGSEMEFSTAVKGRNGEVLVIDGVKYKVYGELMIVPGKMKVYIR